MTLAELEALLLEIKTQVEQNTVAITSIRESLNEYATADDISSLTTQVNTISDNTALLADAIGELDQRVSKIDYLSKLLDVEIDSITVNDVLQYGANGKWLNIQPHLLKFPTGMTSSGGTASSLASLTDVQLAYLKDGQVLTYSAVDSKWVNKTPANTEGESNNSGTTGDLSKYLTLEDAQKTYLPLAGGTVGSLTVEDELTVEGDILATGGITSYNE